MARRALVAPFASPPQALTPFVPARRALQPDPLGRTLYTDGHILTYRVIAAYQYDNRHILNSFNFSDPTVIQQYFDSVLSPDSLVENVREGATLTSSDKIVQLSTCTGDSNHIVRRYLVTGVLVSDQPTY